MKQKILAVCLLAKYYPVTAVGLVVTFLSYGTMHFLPYWNGEFLHLLFPCSLALSVVVAAYNISFSKCKFDVGKVNRASLLEVLYSIEEMDAKIPVESVYRKRSRRPLLCFIFWSRGSVEKRLMKWMGVNPDRIMINDKQRFGGSVAGIADVRNKEIRMDGNLREKHPNAYLTTLVHEIAHMLAAQIHLHSYIVTFEEEFIDTLCVYLGLGDVMLNGCISYSCTETWMGAYIERQYESVKIGYLSPIQLAIAEVFMKELTKDYEAKRKIYSRYSYWLLTRVRMWLDLNGINYKYNKDLRVEGYLHNLRKQIEKVEEKTK